jgi:ACS family glucarate transporter-like MFS transporter
MLRFGWESAFYIAGAVGLVLALLFHFSVQEERHLTTNANASLATKTPWMDLLKNRQLWLLTVSSFFLGYIAYIFISWFYLYLVEVRGFALLRGSFYAALPFITAVAGFPIGGLLGDLYSARVGTMRARRIIVIAAMLPASVLLFVGAIVNDPIWAIAALSLTAGLCSLTQSSYWVIAIDSVRSHTATAVGFMNTGFNLGGVCSPILTPWIASRYGWAAALAVASFAGVSVVILWTFVRESRRTSAGELVFPRSLNMQARTCKN